VVADTRLRQKAAACGILPQRKDPGAQRMATRGPRRERHAHPILRREDAERQGLDRDIGMAMRQGDEAALVGELRGIQHGQPFVGSNAVWSPHQQSRWRA